jgi:ubiquinone/menaquinone biosynthesis C-methylase UbiE
VIICNAVLEHVRNPHEVMREFNRVLKIGGHLYLSVPFMQPEHRCPTDFQRYTRDGLGELCERFGFTVEKIEGVHSVYHTLGWIVHCWLAQPTWRHLALRTIFTPALRLAQRLRSRSYVDSIASGYRAWARKERSL